MLIFLSVVAYRIHSIFVLRLFNDPIAMLLAYVAVNFFIEHKWGLGCFFFSVAVSVKMNVLLFAPALLAALLGHLGVLDTVTKLSICAAVQIIPALPFLAENAGAYLQRSFDLGRQFFYIWTVNWKCISEDLFLHRGFQLSLLALHAAVLVYFAATRWRHTRITSPKGFFFFVLGFEPVLLFTANAYSLIPLSARDNAVHCQLCGHCVFTHAPLPVLLVVLFLAPVFTLADRLANTATVPFFLCPFLLALHQLKIAPAGCGRVAVLVAIEYSFNVFPATTLSSGVLQAAHLVLLLALVTAPKVDSISHAPAFQKKNK